MFMNSKYCFSTKGPIIVKCVSIEDFFIQSFIVSLIDLGLSFQTRYLYEAAVELLGVRPATGAGCRYTAGYL